MSFDRDKAVQGMAEEMAKVFARELKYATRCCPTCEHFNQRLEVCTKANPPVRPPAKVIAFGCPLWSDAPPF